MLIAKEKPCLFAGVSIWATMTDLRDWYIEMKARKNYDYSDSIEKAFGGSLELPLLCQYSPVCFVEALKNTLCNHSPVCFAEALRNETHTLIDLNAGITDGHHGTVAVSHSLKLYNAIADPKDRLSEADYERLKSGKKELFTPIVPPDETYGVKVVLLRRVSRNVRLSVFNGDHEMIPQAAIEWLSKQQR
jgi:hypothetical protein